MDQLAYTDIPAMGSPVAISPHRDPIQTRTPPRESNPIETPATATTSSTDEGTRGFIAFALAMSSGETIDHQRLILGVDVLRKDRSARSDCLHFVDYHS